MPRPLLAIALLALSLVRASAGGIEDAALAPNAQVYSCAPGPWGHVEWHYIYLEAPEWIVAEYPMPSPDSTWSFPDSTPEKVAAFLKGAGLPADAVEALLADKRALLKGGEAVTLFPSVALIEAIPAPARGVIYAELAKSPVNTFYAEPFYILDETIDDWLGDTEVRPEIRAALERLSYKRGDVLAFSDISVLMNYARDSTEALHFIKLCTRIRTIMAYLRVDDGADLRGLEKYWSAGLRHKDVFPMLESMSRIPGGGRLGFAHLLPSEPRKLLYSYPSPSLAAKGRLPNCHWTTLNFFNYEPQDLYLDLRLASSRVKEGYKMVAPPYTFGDALMYLNKDGGAVHSCTYLCDDLVFTKNGDVLSAPWVISRIGTVQRLYSPAGATSIQGYRRILEK